MDEENEEAEEQESTTEDKTAKPEVKPGKGNKPSSAGYIDRVDALVKRLEEAEKKATERAAELNELYARMKIGGETMVSPAEPQSVKQKAEQLARLVLEQQGYDTWEQSKKKLEPVMF